MTTGSRPGRGRRVLREVWGGKGIGRTLMNLEAEERVKPRGTVLDVGGRGMPSYRRFLDTMAAGRFVVVDLEPRRTDVAASVTALPVADQGADTILCFNVLEHVYPVRDALKEIFRALDPNGMFYGYVPFLVRIHADPHDHWRYTGDTLRLLLEEAGFREVEVTPLGGLFSALFDLGRAVLPWGVLRVAAAVPALLLDRLYGAVVGPGENRRRYPTGYFFQARKP